MNTKIKLAILLALTVSQGKAQSRYNVIYEQQLAMNFAAENFNAGFHLFDYLDSLVTPKSIICKDNIAAKVIKPFYRLSKLFLLNYLIADFTLSMHQERFGQGYRVLDSDGEISNIVYKLPPPFTDNEFSWITVNYNDNHTTHQTLAFLSGGSETNMVLSDIIRENVFLKERFNYNLAFPYLYTLNDMTGNTAFVTSPASDPVRYRQIINSHYEGEKLTQKKMKTYGLTAMFSDPISFFALKSVFYNYLVKGEHSSKLSMMRFSKRSKYLPRFRF